MNRHCREFCTGLKPITNRFTILVRCGTAPGFADITAGQATTVDQATRFDDTFDEGNQKILFSCANQRLLQRSFNIESQFLKFIQVEFFAKTTGTLVLGHDVLE